MNDWAPRVLDALKKLPELRDVTSDQQSGGTTATLTIDRDAASRFGIQPTQIDDTLYDAFGQRQVTQYFTQINSYYVILEVPNAMQGRLATLRQALREVQLRHLGPAVDLRAAGHAQGGAAGGQPPEPVPGGHRSLQPRPRRLARRGGRVDQTRQRADRRAADVAGHLPGHRAAFQSSLSSEPYLIAAALVAVYIILGILYESYILPVTILSTLPSAGVGALLMLLLFGYDLSVIAMIGIILLIGIVKKNGIMMVDFAIHAERDDGETPFDAIRQACLLRFRPIMMTTMAALLSRPAADAWPRRRLGAAPPAGLRHGRRAGAEPDR